MPGSDPRTQGAAPAESSVLPVVRKPSKGVPGWAIFALIALLAVALFLVLNARRLSVAAPTTQFERADAMPLPAPPPPLAIPEAPAPLPAPTIPAPAAAPPTPASPSPSRPAIPPAPPAPYVPQPQPQPATPPPAPARTAGGPVLVIDNSAQRAAPETGGNAQQPGATRPPSISTERARASIFANRAATVPQGTLIPAVLETAFNSTSAGFARAIVSRDVRGFDGARVLIPRGSRLIGEYGADTAQGQNRALILWTRLLRPDGVTIAIGSPATDPVGQGGIKAHVNSHFFARFSGAILQSALNVGVNLAASRSGNPVLVALPGSLQGSVGQAIPQNDIAPTLSVKAGTSISVFVARDLDFGDAAATP